MYAQRMCDDLMRLVQPHRVTLLFHSALTCDSVLSLSPSSLRCARRPSTSSLNATYSVMDTFCGARGEAGSDKCTLLSLYSLGSNN